MTDLPDLSDPSADDAPPQGRRLFSAGFWAMMALCLLCVLAGAAVVAFGPMVSSHGAPAAAPPDPRSRPPQAAAPLAPAPSPAKEALPRGRPDPAPASGPP